MRNCRREENIKERNNKGKSIHIFGLFKYRCGHAASSMRSCRIDIWPASKIQSSAIATVKEAVLIVARTVSCLHLVSKVKSSLLQAPSWSRFLHVSFFTVPGSGALLGRRVVRLPMMALPFLPATGILFLGFCLLLLGLSGPA